jgi:hypothetical protein
MVLVRCRSIQTTYASLLAIRSWLGSNPAAARPAAEPSVPANRPLVPTTRRIAELPFSEAGLDHTVTSTAERKGDAC